MKKSIFFALALSIAALNAQAATYWCNLNSLNGHYVARGNGDETIINGTLEGITHPYKISIADGGVVVLQDAAIHGVDDNNCRWAGITCQGDATIILRGSNIVTGFHNCYAGIYVPEGKTLTIKQHTLENGSLTVTSNGLGAAIGANWNKNCGNIFIESGTIIAKVPGNMSSDAAAIGGVEGICGNITIKGGYVEAYGGSQGPGIGSGSHWAYNIELESRCGDITISGGTVLAKSGGYSAGIGAGQNASCGKITITSGVTKVTAYAGYQAPRSVGLGLRRDVPEDAISCGTITVGGIVYPNGITDNPFVYPNSEAIDQIQADPSRGVKFLRNGQLLILRGDYTYSVTGQEVR